MDARITSKKKSRRAALDGGSCASGVASGTRPRRRLAVDRAGADRAPVGPYRVRVEAERTLHLRFNDLTDPASIPRDTDYASVIRSDVPIVVQHTRLDSRQADNALLSTIAWAG